MGKKHLSEDEIKYIVSVETAKAQQDIHALTKENKSLKKEESERRKVMVDLESQGKKNSKEYKNLEKGVKEYSRRIAENNKKLSELTNKLDINAMSANQLKKMAKALAAQLDDMAQSAHPEEYAKLDKRLQSVRSRMAELKGSGRNVRQEFDLTQGALSKLKAVAVAFITVKLAGYLKDITSHAYSTRKEFAKYEAVLRNTFQSQEKAAQAMKMLQQLAADTPGSFKEWTEAFIKLVNRGIKPTSSELTNMGDLAASQGKNIDQLIEAVLDSMTGENERLKEFGIKANKNGNTVKYTFRGVTTEVQNSDEAIKNYLLSLGQLEGVAGSMAVQMKELEGIESNFGDTMEAFYNNLGKRFEESFKKAISWATRMVRKMSEIVEPLEDSYKKQFNEVVRLENEMPGLIDKYKELKSKTSLSVEEHQELNKIMNIIADNIPGVVSKWGEYGDVMDINIEKVDEFITMQKAKLQYMNRELIDELKKNIFNYQRDITNLTSDYEHGGKLDGNRMMAKRDPSTLPELEEEIDKKRKLLEGAKSQLSDLEGVTLENQIKDEKTRISMRKHFMSINKSMLSAWLKDEKNAVSEYREIAQEIYNKRFPTAPSTDKDSSDPNAVALKNLESTHEAEVNEIRLAGQEKQQAENEINMAILISDRKYYEKRIATLEKFKQSEKKSSKQADYQKQIVANKSKLIETEVSMEKQKILALEKLRQDDLNKEQAITKSQQIFLTTELANKHITKEQYDMMMLSLDSASAETRLAIEERYLNDVNDLELKNGKLKSDAVKKANDAVLTADQEATNARAAIQTKMNDLVKDFKSQFKLTTVDEDLQAQIKVLDATYAARKELAEKEHIDSQELDSAYLKAKEQLIQDSENRINQIRNQYGLLNQKQQYEMQLQQLQEYLDNETLTQEEHEQAVQNLKRDSFKKQFDYYLDLFSGAVQALQQAEIDNVDAQYDAEIEAAKGNSKEVERLENEKAQKKLDIQKKYADVNFAIKTSQIIADTAVSIMKAFADLGPIAGAIAAALMGATGIAQIASANAERKKVKNMTLSGSKSSGTGARVATGRETGGKIDVKRAQDGKLFPGTDYDPDARGFIDKPTVIVGEGPSGQSKEWVASNAAVSNPTIAPVLDILDKSQQAGTIRTLDLNQAIRARMAGYASGGSISHPVISSPHPISPEPGAALPPELMKRFANAIINLDEYGVPASVSLTEFERKQQLRDRSRNLAKK